MDALSNQDKMSKKVRPETLILQGLKEALSWVHEYDLDAQARCAVEGAWSRYSANRFSEAP